MVAAGLDTLPGNINMTTAYLSSSRGQEIQDRAYEEIIKSYPDEDPWHACLLQERSTYMQSFVKVCIRVPVNGKKCVDVDLGGPSLLVHAEYVFPSDQYQRDHLPRGQDSRRNDFFNGKNILLSPGLELSGLLLAW